MTRGSQGRRKENDDHHQRLDELLALFEVMGVLVQRFVGPAGEGLQAAATLLRPGEP